MEHFVDIRWDDEARVWYAVCDSIPLALESGSFDALLERVKNVAPEILAENGTDAGSIREARSNQSLDALFAGHSGKYRPEEVDTGEPVGREVLE